MQEINHYLYKVGTPDSSLGFLQGLLRHTTSGRLKCILKLRVTDKNASWKCSNSRELFPSCWEWILGYLANISRLWYSVFSSVTPCTTTSKILAPFGIPYGTCHSMLLHPRLYDRTTTISYLVGPVLPPSPPQYQSPFKKFLKQRLQDRRSNGVFSGCLFFSGR